MALDDDASSSSSCATSDDRMAIKLRVVRRKKKIEVSTDAVPAHNAETIKPPKAQSPRKSPVKKKKKTSPSTSVTLPDNQTADGPKIIASPTKKKPTTDTTEGAVKKSPTKGKKADVTKSTDSSRASNAGKTLPEGINASTLGSPTKKKKDSKIDVPHEAGAEPKTVSPRKSKSVKKPKTETRAVSVVPSSPEVTKIKKKKTSAEHDFVQQQSTSLPKRPQTAPTLCKKKVILSSDDESSVENAQVVPIKTPPLTTPPSKTKSRFTFISSDDGSSSDSSDASFGQKRAGAKPADKPGNDESQAPNKVECNLLQKQDTSDDNESSSDDTDLPAKRSIDKRQLDTMVTRSVPSRTYSGESTDSEPPFPLDLRPGGRKLRSMSLGSTDSEPPISLNLRPGQTRRTIANDTSDSEPPFPLNLRPGGGPARTDSAASTDSEPPFSLGLRPGAPVRSCSNGSSSSDSMPPIPLGLRPGATREDQQAFRKDDQSGGRPEKPILQPPARTFIAASTGTGSEPPTSIEPRPEAHGPERSAPHQAQELPCFGTESIVAQLHHSEGRKSKPLIAVPSYVPSCQDEGDRAKYLGRELFSMESNLSKPVAVKEEKMTMDSVYRETGKQQRRASFGGAGTARAIGSPIRGVQKGGCCPALQQLTESNQNLLNEVKLRPVVLDMKAKKKKSRRRRESFLFKDLQRFAKKTAKEIQSDDEGISDEGVSDEGLSDMEPLMDYRRDEFCGEQSLNLHDAMDSSDSGGHDTDFHQSAPISAMQTNISGRSAVIEPITPKFEEIRRMFLQEKDKKSKETDGGVQGRRHSSLIETGDLGSMKALRRHSALGTSFSGTGEFQNDSQSSSNRINCPEAGKLDPQTVPDRSPSASLTNVVSLKERIKQLSLDNSVKWSEKTEERPSTIVHSGLKMNGFSKGPTTGVVENSTFLSIPSINRQNGPQTVNNRVKAATHADKQCLNAVSSSMDALLSPRKDFSSKPSTTNCPYGIQTDLGKGKTDTQMAKQSFNKSMGSIQSHKFFPDVAKKAIDKNNDSLEDLKAIAEALQTEIDEVDKTNNHSSSNCDSGDENIGEETPDRFDASISAGACLTKYFSTSKPKVQTKEDDDDKSLESTLSYDVQDVLTSFSQQRKLAMQRARATARPTGGKLGDRLKFLQSS